MHENTLLNVFNSTVDTRLNEKIDILKRKWRKCPIPKCNVDEVNKITEE